MAKQKRSKKRPHWTQTPAGKRQMHLNALKKAQLDKEKEEANAKQPAQEINEAQLGFAFGYTKCWLDLFADSIQISRSTLADGVAKLLRH